MPSPFPGMDPYLEGYIWPDVHNALANKIRQMLAPQVRPRYAVRMEISVIEDDPTPEVGIMYPDVELMIADAAYAGPLFGRAGAAQAVATLAPLEVIAPHLVEVRLVTIEIRDVARNQLVTCIEILSPVNKREPGATVYRAKHERLWATGVHILELDLLRRGTRPLALLDAPDSDYRVTLVRAGSQRTGVWPLALRDALPTLPVPLRAPDHDVTLDLGAALAAIYEEAVYELSLNYRQPPPPPTLAEQDAAWAQACVAAADANKDAPR